MKRVFTLSFLLSMLATLSWADDAGFSFLRLPLEASPTAMGEAVVAAADDASGILYNPACLALIQQRQARAGYIKYVADIDAGNIYYVHPYNPRTTLSAGLSYLNSGNIKETTLDLPTGTGKEFTYTNSYLSLGWGRVFSPQLFIGGLVKGVYDKVQAYSASALAVDLGMIYEIDMDRVARGLFRIAEPGNYGTSLAAGFSVQNLGLATKAFVDQKEKLPLTCRAGLAYRPAMRKITVAWSLSKAVDTGINSQFGLEYVMREIISLRLGYNSSFSDVKTGSDLDDFSGLACGFGVNYRNYRLDFAYTPFSGLGNPLRAGIGAEF